MPGGFQVTRCLQCDAAIHQRPAQPALCWRCRQELDSAGPYC